MGLHIATIVSILPTSGYTAGSLFAACGAGVDTAIRSAQKNRTCCNCDFQEGESPHPASYRNCSHKCKSNLRATTHGSAGRRLSSKYTTSDQSFAAALRRSDQQHQLQPSKQKKATVFRQK